jgi:hypothetical protein
MTKVQILNFCLIAKYMARLTDKLDTQLNLNRTKMIQIGKPNGRSNNSKVKATNLNDFAQTDNKVTNKILCIFI